MTRFVILLISALHLTFSQEGKMPGRIFQNQPAPADFYVYGNPSGASAKITFDAPRAGNGYLSLFSESGNLLSRKRVDVLGGRNQWKQNLPVGGSGKYLVVFNMDSIERKSSVFKSAPN